jgi:hypothetical protein
VSESENVIKEIAEDITMENRFHACILIADDGESVCSSVMIHNTYEQYEILIQSLEKMVQTVKEMQGKVEQ